MARTNFKIKQNQPGEKVKQCSSSDLRDLTTDITHELKEPIAETSITIQKVINCPGPSANYNRAVCSADLMEEELGIKIVQINLNNTRAATALAAKYIQENNIELALLQDAYVGDEGLYGFPRGWTYFYSKNKRAWIVLSNRRRTITMAYQTWDSVFVTLDMPLEQLIIGSQYVSPVEDLPSSLEDLKPILTSKNPLILGADLNARSTAWGYKHTDQRGIFLTNFLATHALTLQNSQFDPPTFSKNNKYGWPDVTISNLQGDKKINSWMVMDDFTASDHNYIVFTLNTTPKEIPRRRFKTEHSTHAKFIKLYGREVSRLQANLDATQTTDALDVFTKELIVTLQSICKKCYRLKNLGKRPVFTWWNSELATQRNKIRALTRRLRKTTQEEKTALRTKISQESAKFKKQVKLAKRRKWQQFCSQTEERFGMAFRMAHGRLFIPDEIQVSWQGAPNLSKKEQLISLTEHHFPLKPSAALQLSGNRIFNYTDNLPSDGEIQAAMKSLKLNKAPGPDLIDVRVLQQAYKTNQNLLNSWVRKCYQFGSFPDCLKKGEVVYFFKKREDPCVPTSYRPICLLPTLGKFLEKIMVQRLVHHLEINNLNNKSQFGFREGLSTEHAISDALRKLKEIKHKYKYAALVSIDIKGAFDNLPRQRIIDGLKLTKYPDEDCSITEDYLHNRVILINWGTGAGDHPSYIGCPQGSCLGPVFWVITANDLLDTLDTLSILATFYADDFLVITGGDTRKTLEENTNKALQVIENWLTKAGLQPSVEKSRALIYGRLKRKPIFRFAGRTVKITSSLRYLGIMLDDKLSWQPHLTFLQTKAQTLDRQLSRLAAKTWGVSSQLLKTWYKIVAERSLCYGAGSWGQNLNKTAITRLLQIQRPLLLRISRAYSTTATLALNTLTGILPLHIVIQSEAKRIKLLQLKELTTINNIQYDPQEVDLLLPKWLIHPSKEITNLVHVPINSKVPTTAVNIYTDGSKTSDGVAAAFVSFIGNNIIAEAGFKLRVFNSVYQAELLAILEAVKWAIENGTTEATILTDSRSSYDALRQHRPKDSLVREIQDTLQSSTISIRLAWVKAHAGLVGNEAADQLARTTALSRMNPSSLVKAPKSYIKNLIFQETINSWQNLWNNSTKGRMAFKFKPTVSVDYQCPSRELIMTITGHGPFQTYLNRFGKSLNDNCICGNLGSSLHYLSECPTTLALHLKKPRIGAEVQWLRQVEKTPSLLTKIKLIIRRLIVESFLHAP